jgi:hypothetical protein
MKKLLSFYNLIIDTIDDDDEMEEVLSDDS